MIVLTVIYSSQAGARFNFDYYMQQHMPMVQQLLGNALKGVQVVRGLSGVEPGSAPGYLAQAQLVFESAEAFQRAFAPASARIMGDIANYTDIQPTLQFSEILLQEERKPNVSGWYASAT